jgi:hypothetical protein
LDEGDFNVNSLILKEPIERFWGLIELKRGGN